MPLVTIALGANLGTPLETLRAVVRDIRACEEFRNVRVSRFYDTSPVDSSGPDYVNAVLTADTPLSPEEVLKALQGWEAAYGRVRPVGVVNAPRTLDLDVLLYEGVRRSAPHLTIPHPRMKERLFVLVPWSDLVGEDYVFDGERLGDRIAAVRAKDPSQAIAFLAEN